MDPTLLGTRLASAAIAPAVRKLFVRDGPGAGLVDRPVRLSALVSFRGEKRTLTETDVRKLAGQLIRKAAATPGERPFPPDEETPVTDALARRLLALGDLDMDDVQAVRLGRRALAEKLKGPAPDGLSADATLFLDTVTEWACVHILHFFTQRSTFVARTLVEQSRAQAELIAKVDELITRTPRPDARDAAFERRYLDHIADKHNRITIYGIDLRESTDRWPLEVAYLSLEATAAESRPVEGVHGVTDAPVTVQLPADAALGDHPRVLLRGDAGSGKTTLVQWLAVTAARDATRVPFVLPLRTLTRAAALPAPGGFLDAVGCPLTAPDGWAEQVLGTGRGLVMVDGIDEVPTGDRARTRDWLLDLTHAYPGNQWLVTSRPTAVRPTWLADRDFRELTLAPMTRSGVATFVHRWHTAAGAEPYEEQLRTALRGKRDLARMATNPLMCGLICALHRERRGFLPQSRKSLYDAALTMLLSRRDRERGMGAPDGIELGEEVQLELLQSLAYGLILSGRTEMDHDTALLLLERALPDIASAAAQGDAAAVFRHLLLRSGLLREPAPGVVHFVHRTFQDYLGARAAVADGHLDVLVSHAGDPQWEDVVRMSVAHARPRERESLLRKLLATDPGPRVSLLALACLDDATSLSSTVRAEVETRASALIPPRSAAESRALAEAGPLVLELLPGPEGLTDDEALGVVHTAHLVGTDAALPVLRRYRTHPSSSVRVQILNAWDNFDTDEYVDEILSGVFPRDIYFTAQSRTQGRALRRLGALPLVTIFGGYTAEELLTLVAPDTLERLHVLDNPQLTDLAPFASLRYLKDLGLSSCPALRDLAALAPLELTSLSLDTAAPGLENLTSLRTLHIGYQLEGRTLNESLPTHIPLESLNLRQRTIVNTGLRGLERWQTLKRLSFGFLGEGELAPDTLQDLAAHPSLEELSLHEWLLPSFANSPQLPGIQTLHLSGLRGTEDLSHLSRVFLNVRTVTVSPVFGLWLPADHCAGTFPDADVEVRQSFWNAPAKRGCPGP
ncbi:NACHT domain-containing protein [Streptomyces sp. p1417]|uniref:NACHT domain-containing protein n=1 Tax=Streptomyces typhae TaxID=2681492 RepID=A0A6L6WZ14_9ACTN|nr:NACHT domain-containing protein [Streptomyces typhae]MVO86754.1 NACHT domain-containing protein [Streptomyces typhae]